MQQTPTFGGGQHGDGSGRTGGAQVRAFERIDGDVDFWNVPAVGKLGADFFADIEHGRFVAFALADDDGGAHGNRVHGPPHGLSGNLVAELALALSHGVCGGDCGYLHHAHKFQREITLQVFPKTSDFAFRTSLCSHGSPPALKPPACDYNPTAPEIESALGSG